MASNTGEADDRIVDPHLQIIVDSLRALPIAVFVTDSGEVTGSPRILWANSATGDLVKHEVDDLYGTSPAFLLDESVAPQLIDHAYAAVADHGTLVGRAVKQSLNDAHYHVDWCVSPVSGSNGAAPYLVWSQKDIGAKAEAEAESMRSTLVEALELASDPIMITDDVGNVVFANRGFFQASGIAEREIAGRPISDLKFVSVDPVTLSPLEPPYSLEDPPPRALLTAPGADGETLYLNISTTPIVEPVAQRRRFVHIAKDVSDIFEQRSEAYRMANQDPMTGLLSRRAGEQVLESARAEAQSSTATFSVVIGDLDSFKSVNDRFGHAAGDLVLASVGEFLRSAVRISDAAIRWGGEEFLVVLPGAPLELAGQMAERIRAGVADMSIRPVGKVTISLGVAEWSPKEGTLGVVARADEALYAAKRGGRNRAVASRRERTSP